MRKALPYVFMSMMMMSTSAISKPNKSTKNGHKSTKAHPTNFKRVIYKPVTLPPAKPSLGELLGLNLTADSLKLKSNAALVIDQNNGQVLYEKNSDVSLPIASLTKLMNALVVLDAKLDMQEILTVDQNDIDKIKYTSSRLSMGTRMTRADFMRIALMSSENRAASVLSRYYPGGFPAFVAAMNAKAKSLGMTHTHYEDSNGLSSKNMASASDLAKLVVAAWHYPILREYTTEGQYAVQTQNRTMRFHTTNGLVVTPGWNIGLQKTGYIAEAGRCLVLQSTIAGRPVVMVLLDSRGKYSRIEDANTVRKWLIASRLTGAGSSGLAMQTMKQEPDGTKGPQQT